MNSHPLTHAAPAGAVGGGGGGSAGDPFSAAANWFAGNGAYHNLVTCLGHDYFWITVTVTLDLIVAAGYLVIARHWWRNERVLPDVPARRALASIRNIFLFCGLCGYIFIPVKMFWPAWRLYDLFMLALAYYTWRYAFRSAEMKVVYTELGRSTQLAEELDAAREESKRKSSFLNAISHDLRTPLNGLMLQASLADLSAESGDPDGLRDALAGVRAGARATSDLLDTLLEYARLDWTADPVRPATFRLADAVAAACGAHHADAAARGLDLRHYCPPDLTVTTDRPKLERVLTNLVGNAVKYTPAGGVRVEVARAGAAVEVHVIDTGIGIDPAVRDRLFDEFFQVHNDERDRRKGFGLGLSIARRLARQLGGDVSVESAVGRGSRFTVVLPDVAGQPRPAADGAGPPETGCPAEPRPPGPVVSKRGGDALVVVNP